MTVFISDVSEVQAEHILNSGKFKKNYQNIYKPSKNFMTISKYFYIHLYYFTKLHYL